MIAFFRLALLLFVVLSLIYLLVSLYARSLAKERLEKRWAAKPHAGDREAFIRAGLKLYDKSARKRLLLSIYIVPPLAIAAMVWLTNFA